MGENGIDEIAEAYGWLWHIVSSDKWLFTARHLLRELEMKVNAFVEQFIEPQED